MAWLTEETKLDVKRINSWGMVQGVWQLLYPEKQEHLLLSVSIQLQHHLSN